MKAYPFILAGKFHVASREVGSSVTCRCGLSVLKAEAVEQRKTAPDVEICRECFCGKRR